MRAASDDDRRIRGLLAAARQADGRGNRGEAERLLREARLHAPHHPLVLNEAAHRMLRSGDAAGALAALEILTETQPSYPELWFNLALARRALKRFDEALTALNCALAIEPQNISVLLEKASIEEQKGDARAAAITYFAFLQLIPPGYDVPPALTAPLQRAKAAVDANNRALERFVEDELAPLRAAYSDQPLHRFDRCIDILLRKQRIYRQQPTFLYYPGLPAIEFYDREQFPWLDALAAATDAIRAEFLDLVSERGSAALQPYIRGAAGGGVISESRDRLWRSYPFWRDGVAFPEHMARCRRTMKAISACPNWDSPGMGPNAMFSILDPKTRIPVHTGTANTRLVAHLPLIVPEGCGFRVGGGTREWREGEAFVFDDTIEHEAWNDSDEMRVILIVDVWTPLISDAERELSRALSARVSKFYGKLENEPAPVRSRGFAGVA
jgi:aspartyl/asparaginyl beta-hydroxylase (cupin superfamily)